MAVTCTRVLAAAVAVLLVSAGSARAQLGAPFSGTLAPIDGGEEQAGPGASGDGFLYSVLDYYPEGPKLMVNGTFDGMHAPATAAHLHRGASRPDDPDGPKPGPKVFDLDVSNDVRGTLNGSFWISEEQAEELRQGWYYVQIHSAEHPAGALRGWLVQGFLHNPDDSP